MATLFVIHATNSLQEYGMTRTIKAHFDGKVIVPDEPVDLPVGKALDVEVNLSVDTNNQSIRCIAGCIFR